MSEYELGVLYKFFENLYAVEHHFHTTAPVDGQWPVWRDNDPYSNSTMLRLDYLTNEDDDEKNIREAFRTWNLDLVDLLERGDVNLGTDPVLKACDGFIKRGKLPVYAGICSASLFKEWAMPNTIYEYTLYIRFKTVWN